MSLRRDQYQLDIQFITDENRAFAKTVQDNRKFIQDLKTAQKEGKGVADVMNQIANGGKQVEGLDLSKVAPAQLIARSRQLNQILKQIPESAPGYAKLEGELGQINNRLAQIRARSRGVVQEGGKLNSFFGTLSTRVNAIVAAGAAFIGVFRGLSSAVTRASEFEQLNIALETFLGDAELAKQVVGDLNDFSVRTPFEPEQVQRAGKALLAFGIENEKLIPILNQIGDVAAGTGKDFNELTLIYGKARAQGRIQGEELNQLAEAGIPIYEELGKVLNVNASEIRKLGEQGKIQFEDLQSVFSNLTSEGGRFNNLLEKQSQSLGGLLSTARGALAELSRNVGEAFVPLLKTILPPLINLLNRVVERVKPLAQSFGSTLVNAFNFVARAIRPLLDAFGRLFSVFGEGIGQSRLFGDVLQLIGAVFSVIANVIASVVNVLSTYLGGINQAREGTIGFSDVIAFVIRIFTQLVAIINGVVSATRVAFDQVGALGDVIANSVGLAFDKIKGFFVDNEAQVQARQAKLAAAYNKLGSSIGDAFLKGYNDALGNDLPGQNTAGASSSTGGTTGQPGGESTRVLGQTDKDIKKALDARLKAIADGVAREEQLIEQAFIKQEIDQQEYGKRLFDLKVKQYEDQLAAYAQFNQQESAAAEQARTELLRLQQRGGGGVVAALPTNALPGQVNRRGVNEQLDEVAADEERRLGELQAALNNELILQEQFELAKLELRRETLLAEQEILLQGTEQEIALAAARRDKVIEIDQQIFDKRKELNEQYAEKKKAIERAVVGAVQEGLESTISLLSKNEEARKRNAKAIKAFETGRIVIAGLAEIAEIRKSIAGLGPAGPIIAAVRVAAAVARTAAAVAQVNAQKFARGGIAKSGVFGGRSHAAGGTKGYFDDGTVIEVERDEAFAVVNKNSSGILRQLSALNQAGGGVPFFESGGLLAPSTTPVAGIGESGVNNGALLSEMKMLRRAFAGFPTDLKARVVYTEIEDTAAELNSVRASAEV